MLWVSSGSPMDKADAPGVQQYTPTFTNNTNTIDREKTMSTIDLYLNAISLMNIDGMIAILIACFSFAAGVGGLGGFALFLFENVQELLNQRAEEKYWLAAHTYEDHDLVSGPVTSIARPERPKIKLARHPARVFVLPASIDKLPSAEKKEVEKQMALINKLYSDSEEDSAEEEAGYDEYINNVWGTPAHKKPGYFSYGVRRQDRRLSLRHQWLMAQN